MNILDTILGTDSRTDSPNTTHDPHADEIDVEFPDFVGTDPAEIPDDELIPVCDGYSLNEAEALDDRATVNREWWAETGSDKLYEAIENAEPSRAELAEVIGISHGTLNNLCCGHDTPSVETLEKLQRVFGPEQFEPRYDIKFRGVREDE